MKFWVGVVAFLSAASVCPDESATLSPSSVTLLLLESLPPELVAGGREGGREREREGKKKEGGREEGREREREGGREGGREREREREGSTVVWVTQWQTHFWVIIMCVVI